MQMLRRAIERLYTDVCDVYNQVERFDEATGQTYSESVRVGVSLPCRVSFGAIASAEQNESATLKQTIKLFVAPDVDIKAGSRVNVTRNGKVLEYKASGQPSLYSSHQEIMLELVREYA